MLHWIRAKTVAISAEETALIIKALERSAETFSPDETFKVRDKRAERETKLASALRARL